MKRRERDRDLDAEIRSHLEMAVRDRIGRGEEPRVAELSARRELGSEALVKEVTRASWGWAWWERRAQDLRYAFRQLRKNRGFTATAILTLALGIGANSAIFSAVNGVLLNPLPYPHAERLTTGFGRFRLSSQAGVSPADFVDYRARQRMFEQFGAYFVLGVMPTNWSVRGESRQLSGAMVTAGFFEALGQSPVLGRSFTRADEQAENPPAAILSYRMWHDLYGADPGVLNSTARIDSRTVTIVGVMPTSLDFPSRADFWFPIPLLAKGMTNRNAHSLRVVGLLRPDTPMSRAQTDLDGIAAGLAEQFPESNKGWGMRLESMRESMVGDVRSALLILLGAVALVLLIACVNMSNLLLARYGARQRELSIRTSIGAGRSRLLGQLVTENLVLAMMAGAAAVALAYCGVLLVRNFGPPALPRLNEIHLDGRVLAFTAIVAGITTLVFGLAPALIAASASPIARLREDGRAGMGKRRQSLGNMLVIGETALSLCLLIGAGLLLESLFRTLHAPPGFSPDGVVSTRLLLPGSTYKDLPDRSRFVARITEQVRALPGVTSAGIVSEMPLAHEYNDTFFDIQERPPRSHAERDNADFRSVTRGYLEAMRIPLLRGRLFEHSELGRPPVVLVDESFVRKYFPGEDPIGKHIVLGNPCEIIGVVGGIRHFSLRIAPRPTIYLPFDQFDADSFHIFVRTAGNPAALASPIRRIVAGLDRDVALSDFVTMEHVVSESVAAERFDAILLSIFALLAVLLAVAGVYGVFSYVVAQQTHEIGVRMALGAAPGRMLRLFLGRGFALGAAGAAIGSLAAWFLVTLLSKELYGVRPHDAMTFAAAVVVLVLVAVAACAIPGRRAMRVDPLVALRYE